MLRSPPPLQDALRAELEAIPQAPPLLIAKHPAIREAYRHLRGHPGPMPFVSDSDDDPAAPTDEALALPTERDVALAGCTGVVRAIARFVEDAAVGVIALSAGEDVRVEGIARGIGVVRAGGGARALLVVAAEEQVTVWEAALRRVLDEVRVNVYGKAGAARKECMRVLREERMPGVVVTSWAVLKRRARRGARAPRETLWDALQAGGVLRWEMVIGETCGGDAALGGAECPLQMVVDGEADRALLVESIDSHAATSANLRRPLTKADVEAFVRANRALIPKSALESGAWWFEKSMVSSACGGGDGSGSTVVWESERESEAEDTPYVHVSLARPSRSRRRKRASKRVTASRDSSSDDASLVDGAPPLKKSSLKRSFTVDTPESPAQRLSTKRRQKRTSKAVRATRGSVSNEDFLAPPARPQKRTSPQKPRDAAMLASQTFEELLGSDGDYMTPLSCSDDGCARVDAWFTPPAAEQPRVDLEMRLAPLQSGVFVNDGLDSQSSDEEWGTRPLTKAKPNISYRGPPSDHLVDSGSFGEGGQIFLNDVNVTKRTKGKLSRPSRGTLGCSDDESNRGASKRKPLTFDIDSSSGQESVLDCLNRANPRFANDRNDLRDTAKRRPAPRGCAAPRRALASEVEPSDILSKETGKRKRRKRRTRRREQKHGKLQEVLVPSEDGDLPSRFGRSKSRLRVEVLPSNRVSVDSGGTNETITAGVSTRKNLLQSRLQSRMDIHSTMLQRPIEDSCRSKRLLTVSRATEKTSASAGSMFTVANAHDNDSRGQHGTDCRGLVTIKNVLDPAPSSSTTDVGCVVRVKNEARVKSSSSKAPRARLRSLALRSTSSADEGDSTPDDSAPWSRNSMAPAKPIEVISLLDESSDEAVDAGNLESSKSNIEVIVLLSDDESEPSPVLPRAEVLSPRIPLSPLDPRKLGLRNTSPPKRGNDGYILSGIRKRSSASSLSRDNARRYNSLSQKARKQEARGPEYYDKALRIYLKCLEISDHDNLLTSRILALSAATGALAESDFEG